jgi:molybdate transport system regulatory protein
VKAKSKSAAALSLHLRLRVTGSEKIALGPGKVDLLVLLDETGSIGESAKRMDMSYMKAWTLIQSMKPLVETVRGGDSRGGAKLTDVGHKAVALYRQMEADSLKACDVSWKKLQKLLAE